MGKKRLDSSQFTFLVVRHAPIVNISVGQCPPGNFAVIKQPLALNSWRLQLPWLTLHMDVCSCLEIQSPSKASSTYLLEDRITIRSVLDASDTQVSTQIYKNLDQFRSDVTHHMPCCAPYQGPPIFNELGSGHFAS